MGGGEELGGVLVVVGWMVYGVQRGGFGDKRGEGGKERRETHVNEGRGDDDARTEVLGDEEGGLRDTHAL